MASSLSSVYVICRACKARIASLEEICIYESIDGHFHFGVPEEIQHDLKTLARQVFRKGAHVTHKILCIQCKGDVGRRVRLEVNKDPEPTTSSSSSSRSSIIIHDDSRSATIYFSLKKVMIDGSSWINNIKQFCNEFPSVPNKKLNSCLNLNKIVPPSGYETKHYNSEERSKIDSSDNNNDKNNNYKDFFGLCAPCSQRPYEAQWVSACTISLQNTLLFLKTGFGKTLIACMLIKAYRLMNPNQSIYFLVPKVVLVDQQADYLVRETKLKVTRQSSQHTNIREWESDSVVVCTPEILLNQLRLKKVSLGQASIIVFDEAHEARGGGSSYEGILEYYAKVNSSEKPRILALSASPVTSTSKDAYAMENSIRALVNKFEAKVFSPFLLEKQNDNSKMIQKKKNVDEEHFIVVQSEIEIEFEKIINFAITMIGTLIYADDNENSWPSNSPLPEFYSVIQGATKAALANANNSQDIKKLALSQYLSRWITAFDTLRISGPTELANGILANIQVMESDRLENIKYACILNSLHIFLEDCKNTFKPERIKKFHEISTSMRGLLQEIRLYLTSEKEIHGGSSLKRIIVFVKRRKIAYLLHNRLLEEADIKELNPEFIIGGNSEESPTPEKRQRILSSFSKGHCRLVVATNVLEQGLDVEACGLVICFDSILSLTSLIQSRGRARESISKFIIFCHNYHKVREIIQSEKLLDSCVTKIMKEDRINSSAFMEENFFANTFLDNHLFQTDSIGLSSNNLPKDTKCDVILRVTSNKNTKADKIVSGLYQGPLKFRYLPTKNGVVIGFAREKNDNFNVDDNLKLASLAISEFAPKCWITIIQPSLLSRTFCSKVIELSTAYFMRKFCASFDSNPIWRVGGDYELHINSSTLTIVYGEERLTVGPAEIRRPIIVNLSKTEPDVIRFFVPICSPPLYTMNKVKANFDWSSRSFTLAITIPNSDELVAWNLRSALNSLVDLVVDVPKLDIVHEADDHNFSKETIDSICSKKVLSTEEFEKEYLIRAWISTHCATLPGSSRKLLDKLKEVSKMATELKFTLDLMRPRLFEILRIPCDRINNDSPLPVTEPPNADNFINVGRVKITPNRIIVLPQSPVQSNRILRQYATPENLLIASLTDDHDGNPWTVRTISYFRKILGEGIEIGGRIFRFLGCSNSQLREGHCWLTCENIEKVQSEIGVFSSDMNPGRKLTRLALAFAASTETIIIKQSSLDNVEPDIESNGVVFSDGIGRISKSFRDKLVKNYFCTARSKRKLSATSKISAFQIRVGGIKGVVAVYDQEEDIVFRKSMKKFECYTHRTLEILAYSRSLPLRLNRQCILCMASLGVDESIFLRLMEDDLNNALSCLRSPETAISLLQVQSVWFQWTTLPSEVTDGPLFSQIMHRCALHRVSNIVDHAQILVPKGRVVMGVLDETGTLEYGQVYLHIVEESSKMNVVFDQQVIVFRNPVVLPSDIRILTAVKDVNPLISELYVNCIVFPSKGKDSHARECAGGDLDGDLYSIIWDEKMLPSGVSAPGLDVIPFELNDCVVLPETSSALERRAMIEFFCNYVSKSQLGGIANAHLVAADRLGMRHSDCLKLAFYVVAETDAPKKGLTVKDVPRELLPKTFPDFMRKSDKHNYVSRSILGRMFRSAEPILMTLLAANKDSIPEMWHGDLTNNSLMSGVELNYSDYSAQISRIIQNFQLESEADLFSGCPLWRKTYMSAYKQEEQLRKTVSEYSLELWSNWSSRYKKWINGLPTDQKSDGARFWFNFPRSLKKNVAYSFSWLAISDMVFSGKDPNSLEQSVARSLSNWAKDNKVDWYNEFLRRTRAVDSIASKLENDSTYFIKENHPIRAVIYGSSLLGLCEHSSDIDLCLVENASDIYSVVSVPDNRLDNTLPFFKIHDPNAKRLLKPNNRIEFESDNLKFEVTTFARGVQKSNLLANIMDSDSSIWICLLVLTRWARSVGILKSRGGNGKGLLPLISFSWIFITYLKENDELLFDKTKNTKIQQHKLARWADWLNNPHELRSSKLILNFLSFLAEESTSAWVSTKQDPISMEPLLADGLISEIGNLARQASFILAINNGAIEKLFEICSGTRLFKIHHRMASTDPSVQEQYILEIRKKLKPKVTEYGLESNGLQNMNNLEEKELGLSFVNRSGTLYLEATGDTKQFSMIGNVLQIMLSGLMSAKANLSVAYHVSGSTTIIPEKCFMDKCLVCFEEYRGDFNLQHVGCPRRRLGFPQQNPNPNWIRDGLNTFVVKVKEQIELFNALKEKRLNNSVEKRFFGDLYCVLRPGNHYLFNVGSALDNTFKQVNLEEVQEAIRYQEEKFQDEERSMIAECDALSTIVNQPKKNSTNLEGETVKKEEKEKESNKTIPNIIDLAPLSEVAMKGSGGGGFFVQSKSTTSIRHSFYPSWRYGLNKAEEFAIKNQYVETSKRVYNKSIYHTVSLFWRGRELVALLDEKGMLEKLRFRSTRWVSTTIKSANSKGDDVRMYIESRADVTDEALLSDVLSQYATRSMLTTKPPTDINEAIKSENPFGGLEPLVSDFFGFDWEVRSIRRVVTVKSFEGVGESYFLINVVHTGSFDIETHRFVPGITTNEIEAIFMKPEKDLNEISKLCYKLSINLFNFMSELI